MAETAKMADGAAPTRSAGRHKLKKELGLFDVFAISTGSLFSAGFFLLPGFAASHAGAAAWGVYLAAAALMTPSLLSMAELSTALPRAGGPYYFLDRALGPMVGTVGGLGTWLALVFKSCFSFIGLGAYLALMLPIAQASSPWLVKPLAVGLTVGFAGLNIMGTRETTRLQKGLVTALMAVVAFFITQGVISLLTQHGIAEVRSHFHPLLNPEEGWHGFIYATGLVFVSFAGLLKMVSVSEEVRRPERNLPLGMALSLGAATLANAAGMFIMIGELTAPWLGRTDLTPVATAASRFFHWLPGSLGLILMSVAAIVACITSGNAGILGAGRYPLAMSRDHLIGRGLGVVSRFGTPAPAIVTTGTVMIVIILALPVVDVAELAGTFNLLVFGLLNVAVIVMRESRIESYDPGFRSPLYPWTQILGGAICVWIIVEMGWLAILFSAGVIAVGVGWYFYYARPRVVRDGAIYHIFERLGHRRFEGLDREFRDILKEKGARQEDPFDDVVSRALVLDAGEQDDFTEIVSEASRRLAREVDLSADQIEKQFMKSALSGFAPIAHNAMLPHFRHPAIERPEMVVVRSRHGVAAPPAMRSGRNPTAQPTTVIHAVFLLASPEDNPGQHLRILAQIAGRLEDHRFLEQWLRAADEQHIKERLLRDERYLALRIRANGATAQLIDQALKDVDWPAGTLVTLLRRRGGVFLPRSSTVLETDDRLTIIGEPRGIAQLYDRYIAQDDADVAPTPPATKGDADAPSISARSTTRADRADGQDL